jgi:hypothetical protein
LPIAIHIDQQSLSEFCQRHHISKLAVFGSVLREDFSPESDVDFLVEFEPGHTPGFLRLYDIEQELSELVGGRRVDMLTPKFLNHRIRDRVLREAEVQYAQG